MAAGAGRQVGAWMMVVAAALTFGAIALGVSGVAALQAQAADLDPDMARAEPSFVRLVLALFGAGIAIGLLVLGWLTYTISSVRARNRGIERTAQPRVLALAATGMLVAGLLFAGLSPEGPYVQGASFLAGGGGPGNAVKVETYEGELTAANVAGRPTAENVHDFEPPAPTGAIRLRMGSGGGGVGDMYAIAILEAPEDGAWREVARTRPEADSIVDVPVQPYEGALRLRVQVAEGSAGTVQYLLAVSFTPSA